jgi:hypothetical protein
MHWIVPDGQGAMPVLLELAAEPPVAPVVDVIDVAVDDESPPVPVTVVAWPPTPP